MSKTKEKRFDVVIFNMNTGVIASITGKNMPFDTGFYNAEKRAETSTINLGDKHDVKIVPAGKYEVGDKLRKVKTV